MSPRLSELLLSSQSDERLVVLARAGHERAFVTIVERYRPELLALARRLCGEVRGEDVVQQAFLSAFAALRSGAEVKHLRGWLYRIVRNAAHRSRVPQCSALDGATASADTVEDVVQQRVLAMSALTEMARLPARQRQAMVGMVGGMARSEVASTMGLSEGAVRQLVHRARSTLRAAVTAVIPWPLARWLAGLGPSASGSMELTVGAGTASSSGIMLKLGALVASGTLATGVAAVDLQGVRPHRSVPRSAQTGQARAATAHRPAPIVLAAVRSPPALSARPAQHSVTAPAVEARRSVEHAAAVGARVDRRRGRDEPSGERSGTRHEGSQRAGGGLHHGDDRLHGAGGPAGSIASPGSTQNRGRQTPAQVDAIDAAVAGSSAAFSGSRDRSGSGSEMGSSSDGGPGPSSPNGGTPGH